MTLAGPGSSPGGNRLVFQILGRSNRERNIFPAIASMALALLAHTLRCKLESIGSVLVDAMNWNRTHLVGTLASAGAP